MSFADLVYSIVKEVPRGRVATYGQIALLAGRPRAARVVGMILARNPYGPDLPCHRIVSASGALAKSGFAKEQQLRLESEGVRVVDGRVDLRQYQYSGEIGGGS